MSEIWRFRDFCIIGYMHVYICKNYATDVEMWRFVNNCTRYTYKCYVCVIENEMYVVCIEIISI